MKTSQNGINLIKSFEGFKDKAYSCPAGKLTIGYGSTVGVTIDMTVTEKQAEEMLRKHVTNDEMTLSALFPALNQNQFDALMSFIYNVGFSAFFLSGLKKAIEKNAGKGIIENEFRKWTRSRQIVLPGLVKRRAKEYELYITI